MYKISHELLEDIQFALVKGSPQERLQMAGYIIQEYTNPVEGTEVPRPSFKFQQDGMEISKEPNY